MNRAVVFRRLLVFLLCLNAAIPSVYFSVTKEDIHDVALGGPRGDAAQYGRAHGGRALLLLPGRGGRLRAARLERGPALTVLVGMFARESTAYVLVPILALRSSMATRARRLLLCLPGLVAYLVFRLVLFPTRMGWNYGVADTLDNLRLLVTSRGRLGWVLTDGGLAFGLLWILALWGWVILVRRRQWGHPLFRLSFLIPFAVIVPNLVWANIGRLFYLAFPAVIPLALLPIQRLFGGDSGRDARPIAAREPAA